MENQITIAINKAGSPNIIAAICGLKSYQAVKKWEKNGKLPRTEWSGETNYAEKIYKKTGVVIKPYSLEDKPKAN